MEWGWLLCWVWQWADGGGGGGRERSIGPPFGGVNGCGVEGVDSAPAHWLIKAAGSGETRTGPAHKRRLLTRHNGVDIAAAGKAKQREQAAVVKACPFPHWPHLLAR